MAVVKLANNWSKRRVQDGLLRGETHELARFVDERHRERFFEPIDLMKRFGSEGSGFAIMSLCSLLVETIECYREGVPSSVSSELHDLAELRKGLGTIELRYELPGGAPGSEAVFKNFFERIEHRSFFPDVDGSCFYKDIRCGLLHQGQTKTGWRIRMSGKFWDPDKRSLNRVEFSKRLDECFTFYVQELHSNDFETELWKNASRKIYWLAQIS